jgi:hypothetical protein
MAVTQYKKKAKAATTKVVSKQIAEWNKQDKGKGIVRCRSVWHAWEDYTVIDNGKEMAEVLRCRRGHGYKYRVVNKRTGAIIKPWTPVLDKEYYMPKGSGRITNTTMNLVRLAALETFETTKASGNIFALVHEAISANGSSNA